MRRSSRTCLQWWATSLGQKILQ